jgi:acetyl-CoA carboxylase biotin carboxyl carrier protein
MMAVIDVKTEVAGIVWKIVAAPGQQVEADDTVLILESMKMEIPVSAPSAGTVTEIVVAEGEAVAEGVVVARLQA